MKLGYRNNSRGLFIPQFFDNENKEWVDIKLKHLGGESNELHKIAFALGRNTKWSGNQYYFYPEKGDDENEMVLFFENEYKIYAFLGAFKYEFEHSGVTKEVEL